MLGETSMARKSGTTALRRRSDLHLRVGTDAAPNSEHEAAAE
jgi:hypothetical protein